MILAPTLLVVGKANDSIPCAFPEDKDDCGENPFVFLII